MLKPILIVLLLTFTACERSGTSEEKAIKDASKAYEQAFNSKNSQAMANLWAEDAELVVPESGELVDGRPAIAEKFQELFSQNPDAKVEIKIESVTFPKSDEAVEAATAIVKDNGVIIRQTAFKVYYCKINGKWLITALREVEVNDPTKPSEHLKELAWLIGDWVDEDEDSMIISHYQWDRFKNFITQKFTVTIEGTLDLEGIQIIGWDPTNKQIRSWIFDSDGGFGEGTWKLNGKSWEVETSTTLADGRRASSINVLTPGDHDSYTWTSTGRAVGGEMLPDIEEVTVIRKKN